MAEKDISRLNVCFIGHVDSGKSTAVGQLAFLLGAVDKRVIERYKKEAIENAKDSFEFAYVTDRTAAEKQRGITISTTLMNIKTDKFDINILDCPGHRDFIKNMVTGAAQADVGVVVVPATAFESCIGEGGMLRNHMTIAGILGCKRLIIAVNKLDEYEKNNTEEEKFKEVAGNMAVLCKQHHPDRNPLIIPISALRGKNMVDNGERYDWFKGVEFVPGDGSKGPMVFTLEGALACQPKPQRLVDRPLRMPIVSILSIKGIGEVYTGRVDSGVIEQNTQISIQPAGVITEVKSLEIHKTQQKRIIAGENCGVSFKNPSQGKMDQVKTGHVISSVDKETMAKVYAGCRAKMIVVDKPKGIAPGYIPIMDLGTVHVPVKIAKIVNKTIMTADRKKMVIEEPERVGNHESFVGILVPQKPVIMETAKEYPSLGRFAIRDSNAIVAIGNIDELYTAEQLKEFGIEVASGKKEDASKKGKKK